MFARAPERGKVKTRLARAHPEAKVLDLYRAFLGDTLEAARAAGARVVLAHTAAPLFDEMRLADDCVVQSGLTFGERFDGALDAAARLVGPGPLLVVGADMPHLSPAELRGAIDDLTTVDAVVGPAPRGGFYLLGFRETPRPVAEVFQHPDQVDALGRLLRTAGLTVRNLPERFDIDEPEDIVRLTTSLTSNQGSDGWRPLRTARALLDDQPGPTLPSVKAP